MADTAQEHGTGARNSGGMAKCKSFKGPGARVKLPGIVSLAKKFMNDPSLFNLGDPCEVNRGIFTNQG